MGFAKMRQKRKLTQKDFVIGNRSLNRWTTALSAHASDMSNWLFMAYPGMIFVHGGKHIWAAIGLILMMWLNWIFIAPQIRKETEKNSSDTLCGFFEQKLGQNWPLGRLITSSALFLFYTIYVTAILSGIGLLLKTLFPISYTLGACLGILLVLPFVLMGGYHTLAQVDLFQGIFLLCVIIFVPFFVAHDFGGWNAIFSAVYQKGKSLNLLENEGVSSLGNHFLLMLGWGLGYFGQPHILTKFMGIKDPNDLSASKRIGMTWQILSLAAATLIGIAGIAVFDAIDDPEKVFILLIRKYFSPFIAGIFLCAIIAAIINAMSSMLLVLSTTLTEDLIGRFFLIDKVKGKGKLMLHRSASLLSAIFALLLALPNFAKIDSLVFYAWSGLGATFGPLLLASLYFPRISKKGAWIGMTMGGILVALWPLLGISIPSLVIAFPISFIMIYLGSLEKRTGPTVNQ